MSKSQVLNWFKIESNGQVQQESLGYHHWGIDKDLTCDMCRHALRMACQLPDLKALTKKLPLILERFWGEKYIPRLCINAEDSIQKNSVPLRSVHWPWMHPHYPSNPCNTSDSSLRLCFLTLDDEITIDTFQSKSCSDWIHSLQAIYKQTATRTRFHSIMDWWLTGWLAGWLINDRRFPKTDWLTDQATSTTRAHERFP